MVTLDIKSIVKEDFIVLSEEASLSELIGKMKQYEKRSCLVFQNKKYLGLIEKKRMLRSRLDSTSAKLKHYLQKTPIVNENTDLIEAAKLLVQSDTEFLPVEKNKEIHGVVENLDVIKLASAMAELKNVKVSDMKMLKDLRLDHDDPVAKAIDMMHDQHLDHLPIFEDGELSGMLSYKDILRKYLNWSPRKSISMKFNKMAESRGAEVDMPHLASLPISDFSTNDIFVSVQSTDTLKTAAELMANNRVRALPVMDKGNFKGILPVGSILLKISQLEIVPSYNIKYVGLKDITLTENQLDMLDKIVPTETEKIARLLPDAFALTLIFKEHNKNGKQRKFSINLKIDAAKQHFTITEDDWDFDTALHTAFSKAHNALDHKVNKVSNPRRKD